MARQRLIAGEDIVRDDLKVSPTQEATILVASCTLTLTRSERIVITKEEEERMKDRREG